MLDFFIMRISVWELLHQWILAVLDHIFGVLQIILDLLLIICNPEIKCAYLLLSIKVFALNHSRFSAFVLLLWRVSKIYFLLSFKWWVNATSNCILLYVCHVWSRLNLTRMLLTVYENRPWAQTNWIVVKLWKVVVSWFK